MSKRTLLVASIAIFASLANISPSANASVSNVNVWWPVSGAHVIGAQSFKALLNNASVESYQMFWQVDGGSWVWMDNNYAGYPHKEAQVNLSGWTWKDKGPYKVNFIARYPNGTVIAQQAVDIYTDQTLTYGGSRSTPSPTPMPAAAPIIVNTPVPTPAATPSPSPTPAPSLAPVVNTANPLAGAQLYVNQYSDPKQWIGNNSGSADAALMAKIADQPESEWFGHQSGIG